MKTGLVGVLLMACAAGAWAQTDGDRLSAEDSAKRDEQMRPALKLLKAGNGAAALDQLQPELVAYPHDVRVLRYAAQAAQMAGKDEEAIGYLDRALAEHPNQKWPLRLGRMEAEARLNQWDAFERDVMELRAAKVSGSDPALASTTGFAIDQFVVEGKKVTGIVYPLGDGGYHTIYRFFLPLESPAGGVQASATTPNVGDRCNQPNWQPHLNVESDDVDQASFKKEHPELAAKGGRRFSLDTYPKQCTQGLIRFYDGEPRYETARADVIKALTKAKP